jgi:hypothetical protein
LFSFRLTNINLSMSVFQGKATYLQNSPVLFEVLESLSALLALRSQSPLLLRQVPELHAALARRRDDALAQMLQDSPPASSSSPVPSQHQKSRPVKAAARSPDNPPPNRQPVMFFKPKREAVSDAAVTAVEAAAPVPAGGEGYSSADKNAASASCFSNLGQWTQQVTGLWFC